jgi:cystathionine beta-synthase
MKSILSIPLGSIVILENTKYFVEKAEIENGFLERKVESTVGEMVKALGKASKIIYTESSSNVQDVIQKMQAEGISQLPVMQHGQIVGVISESHLLQPLLSQTVKSTDAISRWVDKGFSLIQDTDSIDKLVDCFTAGKIALVQKGQKIEHILTKIDLISFLSGRSGGI